MRDYHYYHHHPTCASIATAPSSSCFGSFLPLINVIATIAATIIDRSDCRHWSYHHQSKQSPPHLSSIEAITTTATAASIINRSDCRSPSLLSSLIPTVITSNIHFHLRFCHQFPQLPLPLSFSSLIVAKIPPPSPPSLLFLSAIIIKKSQSVVFQSIHHHHQILCGASPLSLLFGSDKVSRMPSHIQFVLLY